MNWKLIGLFVICGILLGSCTTPPDIPACRALRQRVETKTLPDIGKVSVPRPNPVCLKEIKEPACGFCVWTVSDKTKYVGEAKETWLYGKPWSKLERESAVVPSESVAKIKAYILNECKRTGNCSKDIDHWRVKLDSLNGLTDTPQ